MFVDLGWLPAAPDNFRQRKNAVKALAQSSETAAEAWNCLRQLAAHALDEAQLSQLAILVGGLPSSKDLPAAMKLAVVGDGTLSLLGPAVIGSALRWDLRIDVLSGDYGMAVNDAMNADSPIHAAKPDVVLVACDWRMLGLNRVQTTEAEANIAVERAFLTLRTIVEGLRPSVRRAIIVQTVVPPLDMLFGSFDRATICSPFAQVNALNAKLLEWSAGNGIVLLDIARLAATIGLEQWDSPQQWHASKLPFAFEMVPLYADHVARTLGAIVGKSRKCLVLDLDNTLWGGVIGDDGVGGIALGQGSATGEAFLAIQHIAMDLRNRGVILAVCSKNEMDAAMIPFREHSEMLLKEEHIAVFQANWIDKAANLKAIAETLNIGLDALVFLDDNPAEREQVRSALPMVAVPEVSTDPAFYPRILLAAGYFDTISFGDDDRIRAETYRANAERAALEANASNLDDYLQSLDMVCTIRPFNAEGRARIAQLINKSNQFNLTTRRYTESEVAGVEADPNKYGLQIQLVDRFGNNGMISVIIADKAADTWTIDTWLMSCRVLGRRVEHAVLANLVTAARQAGAQSLIGHYVPTLKNKMVADHYGKLGFREVANSDDFITWRLDLDDYVELKLPMIIDDTPSLVVDII